MWRKSQMIRSRKRGAAVWLEMRQIRADYLNIH